MQGATAQGRQFHSKAKAELKRGNPTGALQHMQMALTFEPGNEGFKALIEDLKARAKAAR